jgi:hypothetical protein
VPVSVTLLAAFLFSMGYAYLNAYFGWFGVTLHEIAPSIQDILAYSAIVLMAGTTHIFLALVLGAFFYLVIRREVRVSEVGEVDAATLTFGSLLLALTVGVSGVSFATHHGRVVAEESFRRATQTTVWIDAPTSTASMLSEISSSPYGAELHLLYVTQTTLLVLVSYAGYDGFTVIRIPKSDDLTFGVQKG